MLEAARCKPAPSLAWLETKVGPRTRESHEKKPLILVVAIVAIVGLGAVAAVAKETIKVETSVSIRANLSGPPPSRLAIGQGGGEEEGL